MLLPFAELYEAIRSPDFTSLSQSSPCYKMLAIFLYFYESEALHHAQNIQTRNITREDNTKAESKSIFK